MSPSRSPATDAGASDDFVSRVLEVVDAIPEGRAMAYGDVAAAIGSRAARGVGQVMAYGGAGHPWWRVVRASGHPAVDHEHIALEYYRAEGTPLRWSRDGTVFRVDLDAARWWPDDASSPGGGDDEASIDPDRPVDPFD
ncbi:MGMT family protein [Galbitalea sp. SE-J8]|uniref:MGMT family protein n=1 Tax=Galbitalea sp. SE-J8 TaxID=3054952 RepID=UPI00259D09E4|nr:MGMT family protein [Galbitalea sp. SE-J8]MDM4761404.1 MGMT family protein [Galbitalea sp. SE-J8]